MDEFCRGVNAVYAMKRAAGGEGGFADFESMQDECSPSCSSNNF